MPVGKLYVEKHFSPQAKERMNELVGNLLKAFEKRIDSLEWMGNGTKAQAREKLKLFTPKIGYPDKWKDYSSVVIDPTDVVRNIAAISKFEHFYAYKLSLDGKKSPVIDGYTGEQRFFIGWGQVWRRKYREAEMRKRVKTDPHSPSQYRCNGIVSNLDGFYEAFDVQPGAPMYLTPDKRVRIW